MNGFLHNWFERHKNPTSFWLHMLGVPACFFAAPAFLILGRVWSALGMFVGGYAVQFVGHYIEGNRSGEEMLLRKLFGLDRPAKQTTAPESPPTPEPVPEPKPEPEPPAVPADAPLFESAPTASKSETTPAPKAKAKSKSKGRSKRKSKRNARRKSKSR